MATKQKLYTVVEAAKRMGVGIEVIDALIQAGAIGVIYPSERGYLIREAECDRLIAIKKKEAEQ